MTDREYKVRENRARRAAGRQGICLEKSHRATRAIGFGTYRLVDAQTNVIVRAKPTGGTG
jgi:hypothetical protein